MTLNIRPPTLNDASSIAALLTNIDDYPHWKTLDITTLEQFAHASLSTMSSDRLLRVAEIENRVIGYVAVTWFRPMFSGLEGYVSELFIRSDASGHGAGTALLEAVKSEATALGGCRLTLVNLKDRESYKRGFYASRGWTERPNTVRFVLDLA
jgi:GNAT superfamily N-acetyltransferase